LFDLAGANVGERRIVEAGPERWAGVVEHVHQDAEQRYLVLRLEEPSPGLVTLGTSKPSGQPSELEDKVRQGGSSNVSLCRYFYGEDAPERAAAVAPLWRKWLAEQFAPSKSEGAA